MSPMVGSIIRDERIKQAMKQEVLCHKICSPSYLSKIESNQANPSDDVLVLLFQRLNIRFITDISQSSLYEIFSEVTNYALYEAYDQDVNMRLQKSLEHYRYSKYYWDIYVHNCD